MLDRLKSLPLTIFLSILIWMYAEAQFAATATIEDVPLRVSSDNTTYVVRVFDPSVNRPAGTVALSLSLQGPKNVLEAMREDLNPPRDQPAGLAALSYVPSFQELEAAAKGPHQIQRRTVDVLNRLDYFRSRGVTVTGATPGTLTLDVDEYKTIPLVLQFTPPFRVESVVLEPSQVNVQIPASVWASTNRDQIIVRAVPVDEQRFNALPPDSEQKVPVRFELVIQNSGARDDRIRLMTGGGTATVRIGPRNQVSVSVERVPVWISGPPQLLTRYDVDVQPREISLALVGAKEVVEALQRRLGAGASPKDVGVFAYLDVSPDDRPDPQGIRRAVRFVLPEGVTNNRSITEATFRLIEKGPATAPVVNGR